MIPALLNIENVEEYDPHISIHLLFIHAILKLHRIKNIECGDPQLTIALKCLKILVNLHLFLTHLAVAIVVFFYVSFSSISPFPVVKRSGRPARGGTSIWRV